MKIDKKDVYDRTINDWQINTYSQKRYKKMEVERVREGR